MAQVGEFVMHVHLVNIRFDIKLDYFSSLSDYFCQLLGEPTLVPEWLHAMDGNNSMKQVNGSGHADEHVFTSDYLIPPSKVDTFKDDVQTWPRNQPSNTLPVFKDSTPCTEHWTVANTITEGTIQVFQQAGGFLAACHHSIIETFVEMRNSGEL